MNTTRTAFASSMVLGLLVACSGSPGGFTGDAGTPSLTDTGIPTLDSGTQTYDVYVAPTGDTGVPSTGDTGIPSTGDTGIPSTGQCAPNCTSDSDCASSCPAVAGALNCCDVSSGVCFTSSEAACPDVDSGATTGNPEAGGMTY